MVVLVLVVLVVLVLVILAVLVVACARHARGSFCWYRFETREAAFSWDQCVVAQYRLMSPACSTIPLNGFNVWISAFFWFPVVAWICLSPVGGTAKTWIEVSISVYAACEHTSKGAFR